MERNHATKLTKLPQNRQKFGMNETLVFSLNAVISTNESTWIIAGHVIYNPAYMYLQIPTENHHSDCTSKMAS